MNPIRHKIAPERKRFETIEREVIQVQEILSQPSKFRSSANIQRQEIQFSNGLSAMTLCFFSREFRIFSFFALTGENDVTLEIFSSIKS
jgi:hypothetical protein